MFDSIVIIKKLDNPTNKKVEELASTVEMWAETNNIDVTYDIAKINENNKKRLYISVGGDGTFLYAARKSIKDPGSSVLGVNAGNLGFLIESYTPETLEQCLYNIISDKSIIDHRMTLTAQHLDNSFVAVNEIFLTSDKFSSFRYNIFINEQLVASHVGSGVMVSTSTGSTAMSLSSGGAIVSPSTNIMQIVSLAPHTLTSRPIITSGRDTIRLEAVPGRGVKSFQVLFDGREKIRFTNGSFEIKANEARLSIWRKPNWDFFKVLKDKMNWGT